MLVTGKGGSNFGVVASFDVAKVTMCSLVHLEIDPSLVVYETPLAVCLAFSIQKATSLCKHIRTYSVSITIPSITTIDMIEKCDDHPAVQRQAQQAEEG